MICAMHNRTKAQLHHRAIAQLLIVTTKTPNLFSCPHFCLSGLTEKDRHRFSCHLEFVSTSNLFIYRSHKTIRKTWRRRRRYQRRCRRRYWWRYQRHCRRRYRRQDRRHQCNNCVFFGRLRAVVAADDFFDQMKFSNWKLVVRKFLVWPSGS